MWRQKSISPLNQIYMKVPNVVWRHNGCYTSNTSLGHGSFIILLWSIYMTLIFTPDSLVICACWSCNVPLMQALNSVIAAMFADKQSISSSIFLKSFFIFLIVSLDRQIKLNKCHTLQHSWNKNDQLWVHGDGDFNSKIWTTFIYSLTCSWDELIVVFINQGLHVTVQRSDLFHHAALMIHQLTQRTLLPQLKHKQDISKTNHSIF